MEAPEAVPSWVPSRRCVYVEHVSAVDSPTMERLDKSSRRHCSTPPAIEKVQGSRRHFCDYLPHASQEEPSTAGGGRRHVAPPQEHLAGGASQVVNCDYDNRGRRP